MNALRSRIAHAARWLFASRLASPLWLAVRVYLGSVWLQFGLAKIRGGWLTGNPLHAPLDAVARGPTPAPFAAYRHVARALVDSGADRVLSTAIPLTGAPGGQPPSSAASSWCPPPSAPCSSTST